MTDADRQLMAERIAYQVVISSSARTQYIRNGNPSQHKQLQESAAAMMLANGVDVSRVHLTDQGFR